jgi:restriction system protein
VSLLPWWGGVAIAVVGYVGLHRIAAVAPVTTVQPGQITGLVAHPIVIGLASAGQYIVPLVGLIGAGISFVRRKQRTSLIAAVTNSKCADSLEGMSWQEFEMFVGEAFRLQGYTVL